MKKLIFMALLLSYAMTSFAWDATGHRLVAEIAYQQLPKSTVIALNKLLGAKNNDSSDRYLLSAAVWPDAIKQDDITAFNAWHFIDLPFSLDGTPLPAYERENVVWAINQSLQVLQSPTASYDMKKLFLRFLIHFAGDISQPLHCATLVSKTYPLGDEGGGLFPITGENVNNLHAFWDEGAGLFEQNNQPLRYNQMKALAYDWQAQYPQSNFTNQLSDMNEMDWAKASFQLAKTVGYDLPNDSTPSTAYIANAQKVVQQQVVLAGYRLAKLLEICTN